MYCRIMDFSPPPSFHSWIVRQRRCGLHPSDGLPQLIAMNGLLTQLTRFATIYFLLYHSDDDRSARKRGAAAYIRLLTSHPTQKENPRRFPGFGEPCARIREAMGARLDAAAHGQRHPLVQQTKTRMLSSPLSPFSCPARLGDGKNKQECGGGQNAQCCLSIKLPNASSLPSILVPLCACSACCC